jgi:hypothetical protein
MTKPKISTKQYEASIVALRKKGGDEEQSHWESRLKAAMKRPGKPMRKPITR